MFRRPQGERARRVSIAVVLLLACIAIAFVVTHADLIPQVGAVVGIVGLAVALIVPIIGSRPPDQEELITRGRLALATNAEAYWTQEAADRDLRLRRPIVPLRWISGDPARWAENFDGLFKLYEEEGRLMLVGMPGSGKTAALILLMLKALGADAPAAVPGGRPNLPIPVMIPMSGWNPDESSLVDWADMQITEAFGASVLPSGLSLYRELIGRRRLALFLDGLDEMPSDLRMKACKRIDATAMTLVVSVQPDTANIQIRSLERVELQPLVRDDELVYLEAVDKGVGSLGSIRQHLTAAPGGAVETALRSPLMLTLTGKIYGRAGADPSRLISATTEEQVETTLLSELIPAAFAGDDREERQIADARRDLTFIANRMETRELRWWEIRQWLPSLSPTICVIPFMVFICLLAGIVGGTAMGIRLGIPAVLFGAIAAGVSPYVLNQLGHPTLGGPSARVLTACLAGLLMGVALWFAHGAAPDVYSSIQLLAIGAGFGLVGGVAFGMFSLHSGPLVARPDMPTGDDILFGATAGVFAGVIYSVLAEPGTGPYIGLLAAVGFTIAAAWTRPPSEPDEGATPSSLFRADTQGSALVGGLVGTTGAIALALSLVDHHSTLFAVETGLLGGLLIGPTAAAGLSQAFALTVVTLWFWARGDTSACLLGYERRNSRTLPSETRQHVGLLERASYSNPRVMRFVGGKYQFRHGQLQDFLVDAPASTTVPAQEHPQ